MGLEIRESLLLVKNYCKKLKYILYQTLLRANGSFFCSSDPLLFFDEKPLHFSDSLKILS